MCVHVHARVCSPNTTLLPHFFCMREPSLLRTLKDHCSLSPAQVCYVNTIFALMCIDNFYFKTPRQIIAADLLNLYPS
uniref:Uncharacterized protein n=1 Tax=Anguilla anguilla TaxID=7936 RepID=A0A0E9P630_ANGAN